MCRASQKLAALVLWENQKRASLEAKMKMMEVLSFPLVFFLLPRGRKNKRKPSLFLSFFKEVVEALVTWNRDVMLSILYMLFFRSKCRRNSIIGN